MSESAESARLTSPLAPPEAKSFAREAVTALVGERSEQRGNAKKNLPPALSEKEVEILAALSATLLPPQVRERTGGAHVDVTGYLVDFMRSWRIEYRLAVRASLRFIEYAPIIFQIKPKAAKLPITPFTGLPHEDKERVCKRLEEAHSYHVRSLFKISKLLVYGVYYAHSDVARAIGYDGEDNKRKAEDWARGLGR